MKKIEFLIVDKENEGRRLDNVLFSIFKKVPKSKIYSSIRKAAIKVNKKKTKPDYKLQSQDVVSYPIFAQKADIMNSPNLNDHQRLIKDAIMYESENYIVINKPPNYAVHGGSGLNFGIIEIIRSLYPYSDKFNLAHRIDKLTSGCLIIAKKMSALRAIHKQFRERKIKKIYECIVVGSWPNSLKKVENSLLTQKNNDKRSTTANKEGKQSMTKFKVQKKYKEHTHLLAIPITGRTHQIRAHCADAGFPLLGDHKYGSQKEKIRMMLHAREIQFTDEDKKVRLVAKNDYGFGLV